MTQFPQRRPPGLRLHPAQGPWWRIDTDHPKVWKWTPYPGPRNRFDPTSGRFRVRYAANGAAIAARERFPSRALVESDGDLWLIRLDGAPASLHLTHQANLDNLGVDDRINTGRIDPTQRKDPDPLLETCGRLADAIYDWWEHHPPPLVYRARSVPSKRSIAFTATTKLKAVHADRLRNATALHAHLVLHAGFTLPDKWLA